MIGVFLFTGLNVKRTVSLELQIGLLSHYD
jgi:hypothetical protein